MTKVQNVYICTEEGSYLSNYTYIVNGSNLSSNTIHVAHPLLLEITFSEYLLQIKVKTHPFSANTHAKVIYMCFCKNCPPDMKEKNLNLIQNSFLLLMLHKRNSLICERSILAVYYCIYCVHCRFKFNLQTSL